VVVTWHALGVTCDRHADLAEDSVLRTNHRVTRGPIIGYHVASQMRPMRACSKNCYGLCGIRPPDLHIKPKTSEQPTDRLSYDGSC
jgi:hypothetical protein